MEVIQKTKQKQIRTLAKKLYHCENAHGRYTDPYIACTP